MYIKPHGVVIVHYRICRSMLRQRLFFSPDASPLFRRGRKRPAGTLFFHSKIPFFKYNQYLCGDIARTAGIRHDR